MEGQVGRSEARTSRPWGPTDGDNAAARHWLGELCHGVRLSPTQRRVAHFFVDTMPDAAFLSTVEAAARAGVSQPTVTRFAAALGFSSYADFRAAVREAALGAGPSERVEGAPTGLDPTERALIGPDPIGDEQANLAALGETLASPAMAASVDTLARARVLVIVGVRASAALAAYVGYFARRLLRDVRVVTDSDAATDTLAQLQGGGDAAVLVLAMPRYPESTVRALRQARALGIPSVLVVDTPLVDFAADADHVLVAPVGHGLVFDSHAAPVVLLMALLDGIAGADPRRTQDRLEAHESTIDSWVHAPDSLP